MNPFREAARQIEEHGWNRGEWIDRDGSLCLEGAVLAAVMGYDALHACDRDNADLYGLAGNCPAIRFAAEKGGLTEKGLRLYTWNDDECDGPQDADDVVHLLKDFAELWDIDQECGDE